MKRMVSISSVVLASVFGLSGIAKIRDRTGSSDAMTAMGIPHRLGAPTARLLPPIELLVAILLMPTATARYAARVGLVLLTSFSFAIGINLIRGQNPVCHCFGQLDRNPIGPATLLRNLALVGLATFASQPQQLGRTMGVRLTARRISDATRLDSIIGPLVILTLMIEGWLMVRLLHRYGRVIQQLKELGISERPMGLPVGQPAPEISLLDLSGSIHTLKSMLAKSRPLLLVFVDSECQPCRDALPEIARRRKELSSRITVSIIATGDIDSLLEDVADRSTLLVLEDVDQSVSELYAMRATPSAVFIGSDGTIGSPLAVGASDILKLLRSL